MSEITRNPGSGSEQPEAHEDERQQEWDSGVEQPTPPWSAEQSIESPKEKTISNEEIVSSDVIRDQDFGNAPDEAPALPEVGNSPALDLTQSPSWLEGLTGAKQETPVRDQVVEASEADEQTPPEKVSREQYDMIGNLLTMASHKLRTPLQSINGFLELVLSGKVSDAKQAMKFLNIVYRQAQDLARSVKDFEVASLIPTNKLKIKSSPVAIGQLLISTLRAMTTLPGEQEISFSQSEIEELPEIQGDDALLKHAFVNLLYLALDSTPSSGQLYVRTTRDRANLYTQIISGRSLSPGEVLPTVQLDNLTSSQSQTEDLTYFVSQHIIDAHGGQVSIQTPAEGFQALIIALPLEHQIKGRGTILITEDNPHAALLMEYALEQEGYRILIATNGLESLDVIAKEQVDLMILDVMLPGIDGFEVCHRLRASPETVNIPVIMASAKARDEDRAAALRVGADAYLTKPLGISELIASVEKLILNGRDIPVRETYGNTNTA
jgi:CheY-like chemotaxis protein